MKIIGITRRLDELGRIVLPIELRRSLNIEPGDGIDICLGDSKQIILQKSVPMICSVCGDSEDVCDCGEYGLCKACRDEARVLLEKQQDKRNAS